MSTCPPTFCAEGPGLGKYPLPGPSQQEPSLVRLSVNCFLLEGAGSHGVLIDCGAGGQWEPSLGHLDRTMAEAGIDPSSIGTVALTHTHLDHLNGLITRDGREAFANLSRIVIAHDAVAGFVDEPHLERFRHLLAPVRDGDRLNDHLAARAMPGHAPGHMAYVLDSGEDRILFCGDLIHVPAAQFAPAGAHMGLRSRSVHRLRDAGQAAAKAFSTQAWLAGAHMAKPGIGRVAEEGSGYAFLPIE